MDKFPKIIGITGGIGGGKSTFSSLLRQKNFLVYDSDIEAKRLQDEHQEVRRKIAKAFGADIYGKTGLDRKRLADAVFHDKKALQMLNKTVHPAVKEDFRLWCEAHKAEKLLFIEAAVLFEGNFDKLVDTIVLVTANEEERIRRVMARDNTSRRQVLSRISHQCPESLKEKKSDFVIHTDDDVDLEKKVDLLLKELLIEN
jgi:dephospho-CoA kinase